MIEITESAKNRILDILRADGDPNVSLRTYVQGGGCSGFTYGFILAGTQNEDDFVIPLESFKVLIDSVSMQYLQGATIDYKEQIMGSNFVIQNPNSTGSCGCGSSFSV